MLPVEHSGAAMPTAASAPSPKVSCPSCSLSTCIQRPHFAPRMCSRMCSRKGGGVCVYVLHVLLSCFLLRRKRPAAARRHTSLPRRMLARMASLR